MFNNCYWAGPVVEQIAIQIPAWLVSSRVDCQPAIVEIGQQWRRLSLSRIVHLPSIEGNFAEWDKLSMIWLLTRRIDSQPAWMVQQLDILSDRLLSGWSAVGMIIN